MRQPEAFELKKLFFFSFNPLQDDKNNFNHQNVEKSKEKVSIP